jgi:hypothetical protein
MASALTPANGCGKQFRQPEADALEMAHFLSQLPVETKGKGKGKALDGP